MYYDFEIKELKSYKGFGIDKAWRIDINGKRIKKYDYFYLVNDGEDYIGEQYNSLNEAKNFINTLT